jgi:DNA-binding NarL/FixJ family response regulator
MMAAKKAVPDAQLSRINSVKDLELFAAGGAGLLLINRILDGDFPDSTGIEMIARLRVQQPQLQLVLVSNYEESQTAAVKAGALPGFGKRDIGSAKVTEIIRSAAAAGVWVRSEVGSKPE